MHNLLRRSAGSDSAAFKNRGGIGNRQRIQNRVRHENAGNPLLPDNTGKRAPQSLLRFGIQRGKRFIQQQKRRMRRKRTGKSRSLPLTAGKLRHRLIRDLRKSERFQQFTYPKRTVPLWQFLHQKPIGDVFPGGHVGKERIVLEHIADSPLLSRTENPLRRIRKDETAQFNSSLVRLHQPGKELEYSGLSSPVTAEKCQGFAVFYGELRIKREIPQFLFQICIKHTLPPPGFQDT